MKIYTLVLILGVLVAAAACHSPDVSSHSKPNVASPYAGEEDHAIKALSADEVEGYLSGSGMGLAKAAELNSYPGPRLVLDLADELGLTSEQRAQAQRVFDEMQQDAVRLGEQVVERERVLDARFAAGDVQRDTLHVLLHELGRLQSDLRFVHLRAHLQMKELLTPQQVRHYDATRGYGDRGDGHSGHSHRQL